MVRGSKAALSRGLPVKTAHSSHDEKLHQIKLLLTGVEGIRSRTKSENQGAPSSTRDWSRFEKPLNSGRGESRKYPKGDKDALQSSGHQVREQSSANRVNPGKILKGGLHPWEGRGGYFVGGLAELEGKAREAFRVEQDDDHIRENERKTQEE